MLNALREDLNGYGKGFRQKLYAAVFCREVWAIVGYRLARSIYLSRLPRGIRLPAETLASFLQLFIEITTGIHLPPQCIIGPGLFIAHPGNIVVGPGATIGRHCTICHGVTIGHRGGGSQSLETCPSIGDRVYIGPGSAVIGPISVGDDALIALHAAVIHSVPPRGVVVGNPARLVSRKGSFHLITYAGMEKDAGRILALMDAKQSGDDL